MARAAVPTVRLSIVVALVSASVLPNARSDEPSVAESLAADAGAQVSSKFRTELIRGQVVWTAAALKSQFGISTVPEVAENSLAILSNDRKLIPIVENLRGRAFRKDPRLREKQMELFVRRYEHQPLIQVLRIYLLEEGKRYELDYWCDVCAIVMFETGPCSCCQDDNRLRKTLVEKEDFAGSREQDQEKPE